MKFKFAFLLPKSIGHLICLYYPFSKEQSAAIAEKEKSVTYDLSQVEPAVQEAKKGKIISFIKTLNYGHIN